MSHHYGRAMWAPLPLSLRYMKSTAHFAVMRFPHLMWTLQQHPRVMWIPSSATLQSEVTTMTEVAELCHSNVTISKRYVTTITTTVTELCKFHCHSHELRGILHDHHHRYVNVTTATADYLNTVPTITELLKTKVAVMWIPPPSSNVHTVNTVTVVWVPLATLQWYLSAMITNVPEELY